MLIKKTIPGLFNGVSQQPDTLRLDSQGEIQENFTGSLINGLMSRNPSKYQSTVSSSVYNPNFSLVHWINRDLTERYMVAFTGDSETPIEIFDLEGNKKTISYGKYDSSGAFSVDNTVKNYFMAEDAKHDISALTIADYTLVVNHKVTCSKITETTAETGDFGYVYILKGVQATTYRVWINDVKVAECPTGDTYDTYKTDYIANKLYTDLVAYFAGDPKWTISVKESLVLIKNSTDPFTLLVTDTWGNQASRGCQRTIQKFEDLPPYALTKSRIEVTGTDQNSFNSFYVIPNDALTSWLETTKSDVGNTIDPSTMPHKLVRMEDGTFRVSTINWESRLTGDDNTNPTPSFIGSKINDLFYYQDRLGFLTGENVILSRAGDYFNFWGQTALDVLDDDPIDISVSSTKVNTLYFAIPNSTNLMLMASTQQFILHSGDSPLTPKSVFVDPVTAFVASAKCKPIGIGANIYFTTETGRFSNVYEYFMQAESLTNDASEITAHVQNYLPSDIFLLASAKDIMFCMSDREKDSIYLYEFLWNGNEKVQSAWSKWVFGHDIYSITVIDNNLYMLESTGDTGKYMISCMDLERTLDSIANINLDNQIVDFGTYDPNTNLTTWTLPYKDSSTSYSVVNTRSLMKINTTKISDNTITAVGDLASDPCYVGRDYRGKYRFSRVVIKDANGTPNLEGKLQLRKLVLSFKDTGNFSVVVTAKNREPLEQSYDSFIMNITEFGVPSLSTGEETFMLMCDSHGSAIDIIVDSYLPCRFQSATFVGFYVGKAQQV